MHMTQCCYARFPLTFPNRFGQLRQPAGKNRVVASGASMRVKKTVLSVDNLPRCANTVAGEVGPRHI
jgi:hypothetical protein